MYSNYYGCGPGAWSQRRSQKNSPVNISETESEYVIQLYAPSLVKENFILTTKNDVLTIRYKNEKSDSDRFTRREYRPEEIDRSFDLKGKVDVDKISASYSGGVLQVALPKTPAAQRPAQDVPVN
jgi:HSP20 family protein